MQQSLEQYFINEQSDFYNYLIDNNAFKSPKTYRELQEGETIFDKMNTTYDVFRTTENNIAKVREYHYELEHKTRK